MKLYIAAKLAPAPERMISEAIDKYCVNRAPLVPTPRDRIHITTLFLGECSLELGRDLLMMAKTVQPFMIDLGPVAAFQPRVVYLEVGGQTTHLTCLHQSTALGYKTAMGQFPPGFKDWSSYTPHVTLAKVEGRETAKFQIEDIIRDMGEFYPGISWVRSIGLYHKSELLAEEKLG